MSDVESLRSMMVEYGYVLDKSSQSKAEAELKASEDRVTAANAAALAKRTAQENKANNDRIAAAFKAGAQLSEDDRRHVAEMEKRRQAAADADRKREEDAAKKGRDRREASFKQASEFTLKATALAAKVVAGFEAAAAGIFYTVDKAAASLEKLHYSADLSGGTVKGMNAFVFAIQQLGGSAESAQASFAKFTDNLKYGKGFEKTLNNMGVATRGANGEMLKSEDIITSYVESLKKYGRAQAEAQGGAWGIDADTVNASRRGGLKGYEDQYNRDQAAVGNDPDANSASAIRFERSSRRLKSVVGAVVDSATAKLFDQLQPQLDKLSNWIDQHGATVADIIFRIANDIVKLANAVIDELGKVNWDAVLGGIEKFAAEFDKTAQEYFGPTGSVTAVFAAFGLAMTASVLGPLKGVLGILGAISAFSPPAWLLAITGATVASGAVQWQGAKQTTENIQKDGDGTQNDLVSDPESGMVTKTEPGGGNQVVGRGNANNWFYRLGRYLGIGGGSPEDRKVKDDIAVIAESTKKLADATDGSGGGSGGNRFGFGGSGGGFGRAARGGGGMGGGGPSAITKQEQKDNAAAAADELRKAGMPDEGIAAVLGSMQTESSFKPRAHNDIAGGHNGLWQWDRTRWPKVAAWIKSQGGDPWDVRWQTKAYIAEGRAKPGDPLFDTGETSAGFRDVMGSKGNLKQAVTGVRRSERFGIGEEGGREANAGKWLGHLPGPPGSPTAMAPSPAGTPQGTIDDAQAFAAHQRLVNGSHDPKDREIYNRYLQQQNTPSGASAPSGALSRAKRYLRWMDAATKNGTADDAPLTTRDHRDPVKVEVTKAPALDVAHQKLADAMRHHLNETIMAHARNGTLSNFLTRHHRHLGDSPALRASISHSVRGDTSIVHNPSYVINTTDPKAGMGAALSASDRSQQNLVRNMKTVVG